MGEGDNSTVANGSHTASGSGMTPSATASGKPASGGAGKMVGNALVVLGAVAFALAL